MKRAIALSKKGYPAPNPHVGCVLVKDGRIIGEGCHRFAGGPHAEVVALKAAGDNARGATAFVTLEPCNHTGRTGPCSEALIRAGVAEVYYAVGDPNPKAIGGGAELQAAGVTVRAGLCEVEARSANRQFLFAFESGRPLVVAKAAVTLDGRLALNNGASKWITGEAARAAGHSLRAELGAVLVGRRTVQMDDPELTARIKGVVNQPLRIVLDPDNLLLGTEKVFNKNAETWHITGRIDLPQVLVRLRESGRTGLLVEGGATTLGRFMDARLVDRLELFVSPKLFGSGKTWLEMAEIDDPTQALRVKDVTVTRIGEDLRIVSTPAWN